MPVGCREVNGLGSFWLAGRQAQTREEKFAVLGVAVRSAARHHNGGDGADLRDHLSCLVEPAHMGVARGENAIGLWLARIDLDREE